MADQGFDLLVLAELNPDVVVRCAPSDVRFGQVEQLVERAGLTLGSSGAITASSAVAQGLRVCVCGVVGSDETGSVTLRMLAEHGIDTAHVVRRDGLRTGMTVVLSDPGGDRALLTFAGTMSDLRCGDVPAQLLRSARHVHVSSVFLQTNLQEDLAALLDTAHRVGASTSLDPGWDPAQRWTAVLPALPNIDFLLPNAREAQAIAAAAGLPADGLGPAATSLMSLGPTIVVKDGEDGALVADRSGLTRVRAPQVSVTDSTGAGDNFDGGFLAGVLDTADPVSAACRGVASGSISVQGWGGTGRHASRREALELAGRLRVERLHHLTPTKE